MNGSDLLLAVFRENAVSGLSDDVVNATGHFSQLLSILPDNGAAADQVLVESFLRDLAEHMRSLSATIVDTLQKVPPERAGVAEQLEGSAKRLVVMADHLDSLI